jgi:hypothetical protein
MAEVTVTVSQEPDQAQAVVPVPVRVLDPTAVVPALPSLPELSALSARVLERRPDEGAGRFSGPYVLLVECELTGFAMIQHQLIPPEIIYSDECWVKRRDALPHDLHITVNSKMPSDALPAEMEARLEKDLRVLADEAPWRGRFVCWPKNWEQTADRPAAKYDVVVYELDIPDTSILQKWHSETHAANGTTHAFSKFSRHVTMAYVLSGRGQAIADMLNADDAKAPTGIKGPGLCEVVPIAMVLKTHRGPPTRRRYIPGAPLAPYNGGVLGKRKASVVTEYTEAAVTRLKSHLTTSLPMDCDGLIPHSRNWFYIVPPVSVILLDAFDNIVGSQFIEKRAMPHLTVLYGFNPSSYAAVVKEALPFLELLDWDNYTFGLPRPGDSAVDGHKVVLCDIQRKPACRDILAEMHYHLARTFPNQHVSINGKTWNPHMSLYYTIARPHFEFNSTSFADPDW